MHVDARTVAEIELERHREGMLYAERRLLAAGEFEAAAESVVRRSRRRLAWTGFGAAWMLLSQLLVSAESRSLWFAGFMVLLFVQAWNDHGHARRTLETIRKVRSAGGPERPPG